MMMTRMMTKIVVVVIGSILSCIRKTRVRYSNAFLLQINYKNFKYCCDLEKGVSFRYRLLLF